MKDICKISSKINSRIIRMMRDAYTDSKTVDSAISYLVLARKWARKNNRPVAGQNINRFIKILLDNVSTYEHH